MRKLIESLRGLLAGMIYGLGLILGAYAVAAIAIILLHSLEQLVHIFEGAQ